MPLCFFEFFILWISTIIGVDAWCNSLLYEEYKYSIGDMVQVFDGWEIETISWYY